MDDNPEPLGHWIEIKRIAETRGALSEFCFDSLPFSPARAFLIDSCPAGTKRGGHAHRDATQLLVCLKGAIEIELRANGLTRVVHCKVGESGLLIPAKVWSRQHYLCDDSMLLVYSSHPYDPKSYIQDVGAT